VSSIITQFGQEVWQRRWLAAVYALFSA